MWCIVTKLRLFVPAELSRFHGVSYDLTSPMPLYGVSGVSGVSSASSVSGVSGVSGASGALKKLVGWKSGAWSELF